MVFKVYGFPDLKKKEEEKSKKKNRTSNNIPTSMKQ